MDFSCRERAVLLALVRLLFGFCAFVQSNRSLCTMFEVVLNNQQRRRMNIVSDK